MMTIAGSDCSAGAGLQADLKAAHAMGAFALTAVTCVVSEAPGTVRGIQEVDPSLVADQVRINLEHFPVRAVKTGMLYSPAIVRAVHGVLDGADIPVVVDPVMIATAGDRLMREEAVAVYEELLLPGAALLTPNLDEAAVLLRSSVNPGRDELPEAAARLAVRYGCLEIIVKVRGYTYPSFLSPIFMNITSPRYVVINGSNFREQLFKQVFNYSTLTFWCKPNYFLKPFLSLFVFTC